MTALTKSACMALHTSKLSGPMCALHLNLLAVRTDTATLAPVLPRGRRRSPRSSSTHRQGCPPDLGRDRPACRTVGAHPTSPEHATPNRLAVTDAQAKELPAPSYATTSDTKRSQNTAMKRQQSQSRSRTVKKPGRWRSRVRTLSGGGATFSVLVGSAGSSDRGVQSCPAVVEY